MIANYPACVSGEYDQPAVEFTESVRQQRLVETDWHINIDQEALGLTMIAGRGQGCVDHDAALIIERTTFSNMPTHVEAKFDCPSETVLDAIEFEPSTVANDHSSDTQAVLIYFQDCGHWSAVYAARFEEKGGEGDRDYVHPCGCHRFDESLATRQYGESMAKCPGCILRPEMVSASGKAKMEFLDLSVKPITDTGAIGKRNVALWPLSAPTLPDLR